MPLVNIDNMNYELDSLSDEAKSQLKMLQVVEQELVQLQTRLAITQTARNAYANALKASLPSAMDTALKSETLKF